MHVHSTWTPNLLPWLWDSTWFRSFSIAMTHEHTPGYRTKLIRPTPSFSLVLLRYKNETPNVQTIKSEPECKHIHDNHNNIHCVNLEMILCVCGGGVCGYVVYVGFLINQVENVRLLQFIKVMYKLNTEGALWLFLSVMGLVWWARKHHCV